MLAFWQNGKTTVCSTHSTYLLTLWLFSLSLPTLPKCMSQNSLAAKVLRSLCTHTRYFISCELHLHHSQSSPDVRDLVRDHTTITLW